jgi:ribosome-binding protein aMBF1 (putative translation factor)
MALPMLYRTFLCLTLITCALSFAQAQSQAPAKNPNDSISADKSSSRSTSDTMTGSPEQEMMARQNIKAAEKDYQENVERAREAAQLSTEIRDSFSHNKAFSRTEQKKLERLEKITRKIRNEAGGSDGEVTLENQPTQIEPALARLSEVSDKLRKGVEKTPRQVISASVIERANELLEIIRVIRTFTR